MTLADASTAAFAQSFIYPAMLVGSAQQLRYVNFVDNC